jgi:hypothetical protein
VMHDRTMSKPPDIAPDMTPDKSGVCWTNVTTDRTVWHSRQSVRCQYWGITEPARRRRTSSRAWRRTRQAQDHLPVAIAGLSSVCGGLSGLRLYSLQNLFVYTGQVPGRDAGQVWHKLTSRLCSLACPASLIFSPALADGLFAELCRSGQRIQPDCLAYVADLSGISFLTP